MARFSADLCVRRHAEVLTRAAQGIELSADLEADYGLKPFGFQQFLRSRGCCDYL